MVWTPAASNPSEPPPKSAIVSVSGYANAAGGPGMPSCNDGSGEACRITVLSGGGYGSVSGATHYSVKSDPGASFAIDAKPSAKLPSTVTGGARRAELGVSVTPVTIGLAGTTPTSSTDRSHNLLTGQQVKATLFAGYTVVAGSYNWSVSGGKPFHNFTFTGGQGVKYELNSSHFSDSTLKFFTAKRDDVIVSCTATIVLPTGNKSVNAEIRMKSVSPINISWDITSGAVRLIPDPFYPTQIAYRENGADPLGSGESWEVNMDIPFPFQTGSGSSGKLGFAQLIQSHSSKYKHASAFWDEEYKHGGAGDWGLDNHFPYENYTSDLPDGSNGDGPSSFLSDYYYVHRADQFQTWLMYRPYAVGEMATVWIPLRRYTWGWEATVQKDASGFWSILQSSSLSTSATETTDHMTWNHVNTDSADVFVRSFPRF